MARERLDLIAQAAVAASRLKPAYTQDRRLKLPIAQNNAIYENDRRFIAFWTCGGLELEI
jgi:hypothetical protein